MFLSTLVVHISLPFFFLDYLTSFNFCVTNKSYSSNFMCIPRIQEFPISSLIDLIYLLISFLSSLAIITLSLSSLDTPYLLILSTLLHLHYVLLILMFRFILLILAMLFILDRLL